MQRVPFQYIQPRVLPKSSEWVMVIMSGQLWWLREAHFNSNQISRPMDLLQRVRELGKRETGGLVGRRAVARPKVALRNWRALLDKVCTILVLAALQDATEEWCPLPTPLARSTPSASLPETLEDLYALVIAGGAIVLKPLKSKKPAATAAADCIHPKKELKGGGNSTSSYVYCQLCHSRWAMDHRAADMKKYLKGEKGGPLRRQKSSMATEAVPDAEMAQVREAATIGSELQRAVKELREQNRGMMERIL